MGLINSLKGCFRCIFCCSCQGIAACYRRYKNRHKVHIQNNEEGKGNQTFVEVKESDDSLRGSPVDERKLTKPRNPIASVTHSPAGSPVPVPSNNLNLDSGRTQTFLPSIQQKTAETKEAPKVEIKSDDKNNAEDSPVNSTVREILSQPKPEPKDIPNAPWFPPQNSPVNDPPALSLLKLSEQAPEKPVEKTPEDKPASPKTPQSIPAATPRSVASKSISSFSLS